MKAGWAIALRERIAYRTLVSAVGKLGVDNHIEYRRKDADFRNRHGHRELIPREAFRRVAGNGFGRLQRF